MNKKNTLLAPDGTELTKMDEHTTSRSIERDHEDESYVPVILKRTDEAVRHPDDILERAIHEGVEQHKRPNLSLFLSAIAAGLILGFAGMCVALISQVFPMSENLLLNRLAVAFVYPLGFIICIMSGTQLFTEQTATAVYPVLDKKAKLTSLVSLWGVILAGNLFGTFISSHLIYFSDSVILGEKGFIEVANHLIHFSAKEIFISSILAGWLMAQGGWLVLATPPGTSQVFCIFVVTFIIGLGGLHHSIAGSAEIFSGFLHNPNQDLLKSIGFITTSILGNLVGGSLFVGVLNYGHIRKTQ